MPKGAKNVFISTPFQSGPGAHPTTCKIRTGYKAAGRGVDHPLLFSAEVKNE